MRTVKKYISSYKYIFRTVSTLLFIVALIVLKINCGSNIGSNKNPKVVLMVFDGMRPDQVTPEDAPNITRLIANGVLFNNHHAIYPTSTIPNSVAIATGTYPAKNGVPMNSIFIPDFYSRDIGLMESNQTLMEINNYMNGELIRVPTTVQIAQQAGLKTAVIGKMIRINHDHKRKVV